MVVVGVAVPAVAGVAAVVGVAVAAEPLVETAVAVVLVVLVLPVEATAWLLTPWMAMPAVRPPNVSTLAAAVASLTRWRRRLVRAIDSFRSAAGTLLGRGSAGRSWPLS
jgi:hypothetical protein